MLPRGRRGGQGGGGGGDDLLEASFGGSEVPSELDMSSLDFGGADSPLMKATAGKSPKRGGGAAPGGAMAAACMGAMGSAARMEAASTAE